MLPNISHSRVLLAAVLSMIAVPALAQQVPETFREQQKRNRHKQYEMQESVVSNMPKLEMKRIEDVFQLRVENGKDLTCVTPGIDVDNLPSRQYRLDLENYKGPTYISVGQTIMRQAPIRPGAGFGPARLVRILSLTHYQMNEDDSLVTISLQSRPGLFHISRSVSFDTGSSVVRLMQQSGDFGGGNGEGTVQLWVSRNGGQDLPVNININEADFSALVRNHPKEAEAYLRPLLRELGQDQILAPDWHIAWQVLADYWKVDEPVHQQIVALLPDLENPDFRHREEALAKLMKLDRSGVAAVRMIERVKLTPEQNRILDLVMAPYAQLTEKEAKRLREDKNFLLDCLYSDDTEVRTAAIAQLRKVCEKQHLKFEPGSSAADRFVAVRALRKELIKDSADDKAFDAIKSDGGR